MNDTSLPNVERRYVPVTALPIEIEERADGMPMIKGISPPFNSESVDLGGFREVFAPTAFDAVLSGKTSEPQGRLDVVALFNHDENQVLGRTTSGTLSLMKTDRGLAYSITPPDTQLGRDIQTLLRRGDLSGASFAFSTTEDGQRWDRAEDGVMVRTVTSVSNLYDVSVVTRPAYQESTAAMRSLDAWRKQNLTARETRDIGEKAADEAADRRRRWSYALTAAAARLLAMKLKAYGSKRQ